MPPAAKTTATNHANLAAALAAFQAEMPVVNKGKTATIPNKNGGRGYSYSYADLADVTRQVAPLLAKHGLAFTAHPRAVDGGMYELAATLMHDGTDPDDFITGSLPLFGRTNQEIGSAITYARRYLLGCLTGVVTDDDEDGTIATGAMERTGHERPAPAATKSADEMLAEALATTTLDELRAVWEKYSFGGAPQEFQDRVNDHGMALRERANAAMAGAMKVNDAAEAAGPNPADDGHTPANTADRDPATDGSER